MTANTSPPRLVLRCPCGTPWAHIEQRTDGRYYLVVTPRHHGEKHWVVTPLDELVAMQPALACATMPDGNGDYVS